MSQLRISSVGLICLFVGCTSHTPSPGTAPSPSPISVEPTTRISSPNSTWEFAPSERTNTYRSTSYTIIHETSNTRPRIDTLKLETRFVVSLNQLQTPTTIS